MARNALADLEALASGAVALGREVATPILGAGRYINDMMYGTEDASDAMDWARAEMAGVKLNVSPAARKSQQDIAQAVVEPLTQAFQATGLGRVLGSEPARQIGGEIADRWENVSEDTKAGLEMALSGLDVNPFMAGAPLLLKAGKAGKAGKKLLKDRTFYHSTPRGTEIDEFKPGTYFSSNPEYSQANAPEFRSTAPDEGFDPFAQTGTVYPSNIGMQNPKLLTKQDEIEKYIARGYDQDELIEAGHDGIVVKHPDGEVEAMNFYPEQVSSAIGAPPVYAENAMDLAAGLPRNPSGPGLKVDPAYKHQVSKTNLDRPFDELTSAIIDLNTAAPERIQRFEDMVNPGDVLIPLLGDTTRADSVLTHINEQELGRGILQQGGPGYARTHLLDPTTGQPRENPFGWASGTGVTTQLTNRGLAGLEASGRPGAKVRGIYTTMSPRGAFFSKQVGDTHIERVKLAEIPKQAIKDFDDDLNSMIEVVNKQKMKKGDADTKVLPKWVGQNSKNWEKQLNENTELRKLWLDANAKAKHQKAGFPDVASTLKGNIEPSLIHTPNMMSGGMISEMDVHKGIDTVPELHDSYPSHMPGRYQGRMEHMVPTKQMFSDFFESPQFMESSGSPQYMLDRVKPYQVVDDQFLEKISGLEDALLRQGGR